MKITLRVYKRYDLDLIAAIACCGLPSAKKIIKNSLVALARGEYYKENIPMQDVTSYINKLGNRENVLSLQFYLDDKSEKDVIDWVKSIRMKQRNSLIRNAFRMSINNMHQVMSAYHSNAEIVNKLLNSIPSQIGNEIKETRQEISNPAPKEEPVSIPIVEQTSSPATFKPKASSIKLPKIETNDTIINTPVVNAVPTKEYNNVTNNISVINEPTMTETTSDDDEDDFFAALSKLAN